jgi:hypothetical protein
MKAYKNVIRGWVHQDEKGRHVGNYTMAVNLTMNNRLINYKSL